MVAEFKQMLLRFFKKYILNSLDCEDIQSNKLTTPVDINFWAHF